MKYGAGKVNAYRALTEWGTVDSDTAWGGVTDMPDTLYVSGDLTISSGVELTLNPGAVVKVAPDHEKSGNDTTRVLFHVKGTLTAIGTAANPIVFESFVGGSPSDSDWAGIYIDSLSTGSVLEHVIIRNATRSITGRGSATIRNCTIEDCRDRGISFASTDSVVIDSTSITGPEYGLNILEVTELRVTNSAIDSCEYGAAVYKDVDFTIDNVAFDDNDTGLWIGGVNATWWVKGTARNCTFNDNFYGIEVSATTDSLVTIESSTVEDCEYGAAIYGEATCRLDDVTFEGNDTGVWVSSDDSTWVRATIYDCTITNNDYGIEVVDRGDSLVTIEANSITSDTTAGIYCNSYGTARIRENTITSNPIGIYAYQSTPKIRKGNTITSSTNGIKCDNASAVVESTTVTSNTVGVNIINSSNPDLGHASGGSSVGYNIFHPNTSYYVMNTTGGTIKAENNYWGGLIKGSCEPQASKIWGSVDSNPALCSAPSLAPVRDKDRDRPPAANLPKVYALGQNYPNPFNPTTIIKYQVPAPGGRVAIVIYNVRGQVVKTLVNDYKGPGYYDTVWDGQSNQGAGVASGVYFVQMKSRQFVKTRKLILLK
jgi:nitrous oxidase accessory protein NosD